MFKICLRQNFDKFRGLKIYTFLLKELSCFHIEIYSCSEKDILTTFLSIASLFLKVSLNFIEK